MKSKAIFDGSDLFANPFIIAEAGVNHEGNMETAKRLINEAKEGGAHAIKFQTYKADTLASINSPYYWDLNSEPTLNQYDLFKKYDSFWKKEFVELKEYCDKVDIEFMSTPFDKESAHFLNELVNVFKISSSDITNKPFIQQIAKYNKPIILSVGASFIYEIMSAVEWITAHNNNIALLHCVLNYPTKNENASLKNIRTLQKLFPFLPIGYSDHTLPGDMSILTNAILLGATVIEKHFTHDKSLPGNDHYHAMDKNDLKTLRKKLVEINSILGTGEVSVQESEKIARKNARRSLIAACNIKAGTLITNDHLTWKRPGTGISPQYITEIIGKKAVFDIKHDDIFEWNMLE